jgi:hypothetical protein
MSSISVEEFKKRLERAAENLKKDNTPLKLATYTAVAAQAKRIFTDGRNTDGSQFQYNSTTPLYLNPSTTFNGSKLGTPIGKTGKSVFESGKKKGQPHKTVYVKSYKDYREKIGRESEFVNWELSGDLKSDFENPQGGTPTPIKVSENEYISGLKRDLNVKKREGLESRYGTIFWLSDTEKQLFYDTASFELRRLLTES